MAVTTKDDPRIPKLKAMMEAEPNLNPHQAYQRLGIGLSTLNKWIANGWIQPLKAAPKGVQKSNPWSKFVIEPKNPNYRRSYK